MRGDVLQKYSREWIVAIENITPFVREQHARLQRDGAKALVMPSEHVYPVTRTNKLRVAAA